jgi:M6 family metalloprotease-like protein
MKHFLFITLIINLFSQTFAVPAYPYPVVFTQPNGEQVTIIMQGDEFVKFAQTLDGYTLLYNDEGYFCYAQRNTQGDIERSAFYAEEIPKRSAEVNTLLANTPKELRFSREQISLYQQFRNVIEQENRNRADNTTGVRKLLTILMEYPDKPFKKTQEDFDNLFNQVKYTEYGANGSVKDFFLECSYNKLDMQTTVVGPFTAKKNWAYYGGDFGEARELATEAVYAAADFGIDFSEFAFNGEVPSFYMIFAGNGEEAGGGTNSIWSHAWSINPVYFNGVKVSSYACSPEHRGAGGSAITRIGVICHEFGHSLGAPDYYDTNYGTDGSYDGTGTWDLQASGSWNDDGRTPAPPNPRSKIYTYGWATAIELDSAQTVTIPSARIYDNAYFRINTQTPNEYFILENKIRGGFDNHIPGVNMLIYHCAANTNGMNTTSPQKFYPVAANAPVDLPASGANCKADYGNINSGQCTWPGNTGKTEFTDTTIPAMISWNRKPTNLPMTNIIVHGGYITFDILGGGEKNSHIVFLPNYYGCTITPENGFISPVASKADFEFKVLLAPTHDQSHIIVKSNGEIIVPTDDIYTLSDIQSDQIVTIEGLKYNTVNIVASSGANGTISPEGTLEVPLGNLQYFDIHPNLGYSIDEVLIDEISVGAVNQYVFKNVMEPHTISVFFKYGNKYPIHTSTKVLQFASRPGECSEVQVVTITSTGLAGSISVKAPEKFEISDKGEKWYKSFLITKTQLPYNLHVRYCPEEDDKEQVLEKITLCSIEAYNDIALIGNIVLDIIETQTPAFAVYPNPTTGELSIVSDQLSVISVEVFDVYGRKLTSFIPHSSFFIPINISHLKSGIYFMAIKTPSGGFYEKIIKH